MSRNTRKPERDDEGAEPTTPTPEMLDDNADTVVTDPDSLKNPEQAEDEAESRGPLADTDEPIDAGLEGTSDESGDGEESEEAAEAWLDAELAREAKAEGIEVDASGELAADSHETSSTDGTEPAAQVDATDDLNEAAEDEESDSADARGGAAASDQVDEADGLEASDESEDDDGRDSSDEDDATDGADTVDHVNETEDVDSTDRSDESDNSDSEEDRDDTDATSHPDASGATDLEAQADSADAAADDSPVQPDLPNIEPEPEPVDLEAMASSIEAIIFAGGDPSSNEDIKATLERAYRNDSATVRKHKLGHFKQAMKVLRERWAMHGEARGFGLFEVAEGLTFRSNPRHADVLRSTREERPVRLSKPALETLAIIAYRQPVTKPEVDHIRGVDCGGTIRILLDRDLVRIVGKREEPGRPMLYGTTREFLSFFNLPSLNQLPSLREFSELTEESQEEIQQKLGPSLDDLSRNAKKLRLDEEPAVQALDEAVVELDATENKTRDAFAAQGITIDPAAESPPEQTPQEAEGKAGES